jgi:hypothetical protein
MTDYERAEEEIDQLLNDPEMPMRPDRIWALAEYLASEPEPTSRVFPGGIQTGITRLCFVATSALAESHDAIRVR